MYFLFNKTMKNSKGQYFTEDEYLKRSVYQLIKNEGCILEPSVGKGHLPQYIKSCNPDATFDLYEIDNTLELLDGVENVKYTDFLREEIDNTYNTIVGNPPYIKTPKGNAYIHFIKRCFNLLNDNGELIFIVPSDFIKLTSSSSLINEMMEHGTFTDFIFPNNESLFRNASIDVIIFRYCKDSTLDKVCNVNDKVKYLINTNGILTFKDTLEDTSLVSDYFDAYVGLVTGNESVFKNATLGNIELLCSKENTKNYILLEKFPSGNDELDNYMKSNKDILLSRKIRKFNESNWWQWGALRNYNTIKDKIGINCIYISNLTRANEVAFIGKVQLFSGSLIILIPKTKIDLNLVCKCLNSNEFKSDYTFAGRFKIGHRQLLNASLNIPSNVC